MRIKTEGKSVAMRVLRPIFSVLIFIALSAACLDAALSSEAGCLVLTSAADLWNSIERASLAGARAGLGTWLSPWAAWAALALLDAPMWASALALGGAFRILGLLAGLLLAMNDRQQTQAAVAAAPRLATKGSALAAALRPCRSAFVGLAVFSAVANILLLTGSFYMLEVYDRVLPSRSVPTLIALTVLAVGLFVAQGALDLIRGRMLVRVGAALDETLADRAFKAIVRQPLLTGQRNTAPLQDLDTIRAFLSGQGPLAIFDLPWIPLYLAIIFAFHPWLGIFACAGGALLVALTLLTELLSRQPARMAAAEGLARARLAEAGQRNSEAVVAMGMLDDVARTWSGANTAYLATQRRLSDVAGSLGAIAKVLRLVLQSGTLGIGAYLVIRQEATAGIIIAGAILVSRALAPVDLAIAHWRTYVAARIGWRRLGEALAQHSTRAERTQLPPPVSTLSVEQVTLAPPGHSRIIVHDATFSVGAGQTLAVIGPSGAGKSSLGRTIVGAWSPNRGRVCLDGASLDQWSSGLLGQHIGYLPQGVELLPGTIAQNISRFDAAGAHDAIVSAAKAAGAHDLVVALPQGYDTSLGEQGITLSAGQRQRIALARALYRDPFLVVLDEPDANLDSDGEVALLAAVQAVRARAGIVVVITHRRSLLNQMDLVLAMVQGRIAAVGPRDAVMRKMMRPQLVPAAGWST